MSRGTIGRPHYPRLNAPRKRAVIARWDGQEITAGDLTRVGITAIAVWVTIAAILEGWR